MTKKNTEAQITFRMNRDSPEYKWLNLQQSKGQSIEILIGMAISNFGYLDLLKKAKSTYAKSTKLKPEDDTTLVDDAILKKNSSDITSSKISKNNDVTNKSSDVESTSSFSPATNTEKEKKAIDVDTQREEKNDEDKDINSTLADWGMS